MAPRRFQPDFKFVLRLKFVKTDTDPDDQSKTVDLYSATVSEFGQKFPLPCHYLPGAYLKLPNPFAGFECNVFSELYRFNVVTGRFLQVYRKATSLEKITTKTTRPLRPVAARQSNE